ncbi:MAG: low specificity L-threonine aldolase [Phycisphaeraceae bacterium]
MTTPQPLPRRQFASDNYAGICPEALAAMQSANGGHSRAYGDDEWTARACDRIREVFETDCDIFFTFTGGAANALALAAICQPHHAIICHEQSHVETDECGGPELFTGGAKVMPVAGAHGKLDLAAVKERATRRDDVHFPRARALCLTQATEMGTVYTIDELKAVSELARKLKLTLFMDGARFANALSSLSVAPKEITWRAGVEAMSLGGTKNGLAFGEAVVFFNKDLAAEFEYRVKQVGQLCSKMRYIAAPWLAVLENDAWLRHAARSNAMARLLETSLQPVIAKGTIELLAPVEANALFLRMPQALIDALHARGWHFYDFIGPQIIRLMCAWDTMEEDITAFANDCRNLAFS